MKWAVPPNGELRVIPQIYQQQEIAHTALTRDGPVRAAVEAMIGGSRDVGYYGLEFSAHSGHDKPPDSSPIVGRDAFRAFGIEFPP